MMDRGMTHVLLINAGPTPWDAERRLGGNHSLPLSVDGEIAITKMLKSLQSPVAAVHTCRANEACEQAAKVVARQFNLKIRDNELLEPIALGLWQGLTPAELRFRFPSVFPQWEENPLSVNPPEGESLVHAVERMRGALRKIFRRNRDEEAGIVTRPHSLQILLGLLRGEDLPAIAAHLHDATSVERIEPSVDVLRNLND
jgi:broad specificity phosphatase PhoE